MELTNLKKFKNVGSIKNEDLPKFSIGTSSSISPIVNAYLNEQNNNINFSYGVMPNADTARALLRRNILPSYLSNSNNFWENPTLKNATRSNFWENPTLSNSYTNGINPSTPQLSKPNVGVYGNNYAAASKTNTPPAGVIEPLNETLSDTVKNKQMSTGYMYSDIFLSMAASMVRGHADAVANRLDLEREYLRGYGNIGGVGYETVSFDAGKKYSDAYKKWLGEMATDPLSALTRRADWIFTNVRDKWNKEQRHTTRVSDFNQNSALSQVTRRNFNKLNGKSENQPIFVANGKNAFAGTNTGYMYNTPFVVSPAGTAFDVDISKPNFSEGTGRYIPIATPYGTMIGKLEDINAYVSPGEQLVSGDGMSSYTVPGKQNNDDKIPAHLAEGSDGTARTGNSIVLSNKNGAAKYYRATGDLMGAQMLNPAAKKQKGVMMAKNGKSCLPKYKDATIVKEPTINDGRFQPWESFIPNGIGMGVSLGQYVHDLLAKSPDYSIPYQNLLEPKALDDLSKIRIGYLPMQNQLRLAEGRARNVIRQSGGLGAGLKVLGYLSAYNNTLRNIADALMNIQMQNNSYFSDYAKTALQTGAANAQRAMQAAMYQNEMRDKQIAAKNNVLRQDINNWMGYSQNAHKQHSTAKLHNFTMDKFDQQLSLDQLNTIADILNMLKNNTTTYGLSPELLKKFLAMQYYMNAKKGGFV